MKFRNTIPAVLAFAFLSQTALADEKTATDYLIARDYDKYFEISMKQAEAGDPNSMAAVAGAYLTGMGVETDHDLALIWFKKAADSGHVLSQNNTAKQILMKQQRTEEDLHEGIKYLTMAADNENIDASFTLGMMLIIGTDITKNNETGLKYLTFSANSIPKDDNSKTIIAKAKYHLGVLMLTGQYDVEINQLEATSYLWDAMEMGHEQAKTIIEKLHAMVQSKSPNK